MRGAWKPPKTMLLAWKLQNAGPLPSQATAEPAEAAHAEASLRS